MNPVARPMQRNITRRYVRQRQDVVDDEKKKKNKGKTNWPKRQRGSSAVMWWVKKSLATKQPSNIAKGYSFIFIT